MDRHGINMSAPGTKKKVITPTMPAHKGTRYDQVSQTIPQTENIL
nr:hypothetical protein [Lachnoclostridium phocaeense]